MTYEIELPADHGVFLVMHETQGVICEITIEKLGDEEYSAEIVLVEQ